MVGRKVGQTELETVGQDTGTTGALMINGRPVAGDESFALQTARLPDGEFALGSNAARGRIGLVPDVSPPVRAVWLCAMVANPARILELRWLTVGTVASSMVTALVAVLMLLLGRGGRMTFQG